MHKAAENCHIQIPLEVVRCTLSLSKRVAWSCYDFGSFMKYVERERERFIPVETFSWKASTSCQVCFGSLISSFNDDQCLISLSFLENKLLILHVVYWNSFIDEGRNPDEYTRNLLNSCVQRNQVSRGKVDAFKVRLIQQNFLVLFSGHGRAWWYTRVLSPRGYIFAICFSSLLDFYTWAHTHARELINSVGKLR